MVAWDPEVLGQIAQTEELAIAAQRPDGTWRTPRPIWAVCVGDALYVRAAYGPGSAWYTAARRTGRARISFAGTELEVSATEANADTTRLDAIDDAYRDKYASRHASIVESINADVPRASTLVLAPPD